jgi:hypothetical protein
VATAATHVDLEHANKRQNAQQNLTPGVAMVKNMRSRPHNTP